MKHKRFTPIVRRKKVYSLFALTQVFALIFSSLLMAMPVVAAPVAVTEKTVTPTTTVTPTVTTTPETRGGRIAYVVDTDTTAASAYAGLLTKEGYTVDLIAVASIGNTDFAQYDLIIIGNDTGRTDSWGAGGDVGLKQVSIINDSGVPILGNGEGGYAFHGQLGLNIGWGNGWHGSKKSVFGDVMLNYYHAPYDLSGLLANELKLYEETGHVGIHVPAPIPGVVEIGIEVDNETHYPLVAEQVAARTGKRCYELWGFTDSPINMTAEGLKLYINAVEDTMNSCGGPVEKNPTPTVTPTAIVTPTPIPTFELPETLIPEVPLSNPKQQVEIEIQESTNERFSASFKLPEVQLQTVKEGDNAYTQMLLPNVEPNSSGLPGQPDVPMVRYLLAVPHNADARVEKFDFGVAERVETILYPAQPEAADAAANAFAAQTEEDEPIRIEDFRDLPFEFDREAYAADRNYPETPVQVTKIGRMRDLDIVQVSIAAGQYNPAQNSLVLFENVEAHIVFGGGDGGFLPIQQLENPFETQALSMYDSVLNKAVLTQFPWENPVFAPNCIGHEYLIITDPAFRAAADDLRAWKIDRGISTLVLETGNGASQVGTTADEIKETIKNRYDSCLVRPSYVLLLGDAEFIPPFYRPTHYGDLAGTDLNYSLMGSDEFFPTPDMAMGRIPVDTLAQAQTVIDKIIDYEKTPPNSPGFYNTKTVASYFQCCRNNVANDGTTSRSFIETAELVRDELLNEGFDVDRIYSTSTTYHNDPSESDFYTGNTTPNRYYNGALLPADLRASSGYAWDGGSQDVIDAINEGTSLVLHRDHGGISGWGSPSFSSSNLNSLTNGRLTPVVYSINCASGLFDNETRDPANDFYTYSTSVGGSYWAERMLRMDGGAVGIIGDTRNSPTWANSALARGLFDATWPDTVPSYGNNTSIRRLGDIMNYGKMYMIGQIVQPQTAGSVSNNAAITDMILYHVYGDPTMKMWAKNPWQITMPLDITDLVFEQHTWNVPYSVEGATLTALLDGEPVGRGTVVNGQARVRLLDGADAELPAEKLAFSASHPDAASVALKVIDGTGEVTPEGGRWEWAEQNFAINFPQSSLPFSVTVLFDELPLIDVDLNGILPTEDASIILTETVKLFTLDAFSNTVEAVTAFDKEISFEMTYTDEDLQGAAADELQCVYFDEELNAWQPITTEVSSDERKVTCRVDHFTLFALVVDAADRFGSTPDVPDTPETPDTPDVPGDSATTVFLPFTTR